MVASVNHSGSHCSALLCNMSLRLSTNDLVGPPYFMMSFPGASVCLSQDMVTHQVHSGFWVVLMKLHLHLSIGSHYNHGLQHFPCVVCVFETSRAFLGGREMNDSTFQVSLQIALIYLTSPWKDESFSQRAWPGKFTESTVLSASLKKKKEKKSEHQECWILEKTLLSFSHLTLPECAQKVIDNLENKISKMGKCLNCAVIKGPSVVHMVRHNKTIHGFEGHGPILTTTTHQNIPYHYI